MRVVGVLAAAVFVAAVATACGPAGSFFRQYEYDEQIDLSLDGTAVVYVNASLQALNALRGTAFDVRPNARVDRQAVEAFFSSPVTRVTQFNTSRRSGRQFVHLRLATDRIDALGQAPAFSWSRYGFGLRNDTYQFAQTVGAPSGHPAASGGWTGQELVAFRLHLPSKVAYHNTGRDIGRGNILIWEQPLSERLKGAPLKDGLGREIEALEARMETQSILYRTLSLFGATAAVVAVAFAVVIWLVMRSGGTEA